MFKYFYPILTMIHFILSFISSILMIEINCLNTFDEIPRFCNQKFKKPQKKLYRDGYDRFFFV